jgi:hypothetical protein
MLEAKKETNTNLLTIDFIVNEKSVFDVKSFKDKNLDDLLKVNAITVLEYEKIKNELINLELKESLKKEKLLNRKIKNTKNAIDRYNLALKETVNYFRLLDKLYLAYCMKKDKTFLNEINIDINNSLKYINDYLNISDIKIIVFKPSKIHLKARCINNYIVNSIKSLYVTEARFCASIHKKIDIENDIKKQHENKLLENIIDDKIASDKLAISNKSKQAIYRFKQFIINNSLNLNLLKEFNTIKEYKAFYKTL